MTLVTTHAYFAPDCWGAPCTMDEHFAAIGRAQDYLDRHEGPDLWIVVASGDGKTAHHALADIGIIEHDRLCDDVRELLGRAWQYALETWPTEVRDAR